MNGNSIALPERHCDKQAVEWLAQKVSDDDWSEDNFQVVLRECRDMRAAHPRANMRADRFWSLSDKSHGLWVTIQRLLICHDWTLCDCINPKRSAADSDWDNIMAYAKQLMPHRLWQYDDWRVAKRYRAEYNKICDWKAAEGWAADYINGCDDKLTHTKGDYYTLNINRDGMEYELNFTAKSDAAAFMTAQKAIFDRYKQEQRHARL